MYVIIIKCYSTDHRTISLFYLSIISFRLRVFRYNLISQSIRKCVNEIDTVSMKHKAIDESSYLTKRL